MFLKTIINRLENRRTYEQKGMELFEKCKPNVCMALIVMDSLLDEIKNILDIDLENARKDSLLRGAWTQINV